ncbi:MAG: rhamnulokinase [Clostridiaceae bacterium]|nr:rhamnulokinase [Clostridiaceae bacterium]
MRKALAFDLGASSGRAILGSFDGEHIVLTEIHRFPNDPVNVSGTLYWDILRLFFEIKEGIKKAHRDHDSFDSIGIDTWGVDFALIDGGGKLLENPVHYRDSRTDNIMEEVFEIVKKEEIYSRCGIQFLPFNTIFQLYYVNKYRDKLVSLTEKFLFIPDLLSYFLTGEKSAEYTIASTSSLLKGNEWDFELAKKLGLPKEIFPEIVMPGELLGYIKDDICDELNIKSVPVYAVASHDTASAVMSVPSMDDDFVYISSGTWSLFGTELDSPIVNEKSLEYNFTNEGGFGGKVRFLKNIMGLWIVQEIRRQYHNEGVNVTFGSLEREAMEAKPHKCYIDVDDETFAKPGNMPQKVVEYCKKTGQEAPGTRGEVIRCVYESLAFKYRKTFEEIMDLTNKKYDKIHIVGGGARDGLLCQMTADFCGVPVYAGPVEATALGNITCQLIASGDIKDIKEARRIILNSSRPYAFMPKQGNFDKEYERYLEVIKK